MDGLVLRQVSAAETRPLRWEVLRPGRPFEETVFDCDERSETMHLAACLAGAIVGVASVTPAPFVLEPRSGDWQLRGMATLATRQRQGIGLALLQHALERIRDAGGSRLWCRGRTSAWGFYEKHGFRQVGTEFTASTGPHWHLIREV